MQFKTSLFNNSFNLESVLSGIYLPIKKKMYFLPVNCYINTQKLKCALPNVDLPVGIGSPIQRLKKMK